MSSQAGQPAEVAPSKGGKKLPILVAGVLVLAGGGTVVWRKLAPAPVEPVLETRPRVAREAGVLELEPFVLNLSDPTGDRYFRLNLRLVLDQRVIAERSAGGLAQAKLRDRLLSVLARKHATQLTSVEGKEVLREELRSAAEALLAEPPFHEPARDPAPARVLDALFTEFLVQ